MKLVAAAIIIKDKFVLLARRKPGEKLAGYWEFPGGKLEEGETPQKCIERELLEELGIKAKAGKIIAESEYHYDHGAFRLLAILTTIEEEKSLTLKVHDQAEWVLLPNLLKYNLAAADIAIAKIIMAPFLHSYDL